MAFMFMFRLFFSLILVLLFICNGDACDPKGISISQAKTGRVVEGKPEYEVLISNTCQCPMSNLVLRCYGLSSVEPVNKHVIKPLDDERCVVGNGGRPIVHGAPVRFTYAWLTPQDFPVISSKFHC